MPSSGLDLDPEGLDRVAELLRTAAAALPASGLESDIPPVGGDEVSAAVMANLNARRRWLLEHVRAGHGQALAAGEIAAGNAAAYRATDAAAAAAYGHPGTAPTGGSTGAAPAAPPAPTAPPAATAIPDISGRDGETLARALESGAGPEPAGEAASRLTALATQAVQAGTQLSAAHAALSAAGQSEVHGPLSRRLMQAAGWSQAVAAHATDLAAGYTAAAATHASTYAAVGSSEGWQALKTGYQQAIAENAATGGLMQNVVNAYSAALTDQQQSASAAMTGYQGTGQALAIPGQLPDPGLAPESPAGDDGAGQTDPKHAEKHAGQDQSPADMLSPILGAVGPMLQSVGKVNPLSAAGQAAQQLGQLSQLGSQLGHPKSPLKSAALNPAALAKGAGGGKGIGGGKGLGGGGKGLGGGKGIGGGGKGLGGGGGIKGGAGISPTAAVRPSSPATTPTPPAAAAGEGTAARPGRGSAGGSGMGMMPMSRAMSGDAKSGPVHSYPGDPLAEVDTPATTGVAADTTTAQPAVDPEARKAVAERIAKRKQAAAATDDG